MDHIAWTAALAVAGFCVGSRIAAAFAAAQQQQQPPRDPGPALGLATRSASSWLRELRSRAVGPVHVAVAGAALAEAVRQALRGSLPPGARGAVRLARGTHRELRAAGHRVATRRACLVFVERRKRGPVLVARSGRAGPFPAVSSLVAAGAGAKAHAVVATSADPSLPPPLNDPALFRGRPVGVDWAGRAVELTF